MSLPMCGGGSGYELFADAEREIRRRATEAEASVTRWEARECPHCPLVHVLDLAEPLPAWTTAPRRSTLPHTGRGPAATQPCGTPAAYRRHKRRGEQPCPECREVYNRAASITKAARREARRAVKAAAA